MPELVLIRHGKSSWKDQSLDDRDRPLKKRGLRAASEMGQRLWQSDITFDRLLTSPATRAEHTARLLAAAVGFPAGALEQFEELYTFDPTELLTILSGHKWGPGRIGVVGHNPALHGLITRLTGLQLDKFPTAAIARLQFAGPWADLGPGTCTLIELNLPRRKHRKETDELESDVDD